MKLHDQASTIVKRHARVLHAPAGVGKRRFRWWAEATAAPLAEQRFRLVLVEIDELTGELLVKSRLVNHDASDVDELYKSVDQLFV